MDEAWPLPASVSLLRWHVHNSMGERTRRWRYYSNPEAARRRRLALLEAENAHDVTLHECVPGEAEGRSDWEEITA